jgi:hypothetical protein
MDNSLYFDIFTVTNLKLSKENGGQLFPLGQRELLTSISESECVSFAELILNLECCRLASIKKHSMYEIG